MKQEYITLFNVHFAGKTTSQDADALQPLLRAANDDAFPVLMAHKTKKRTLLGCLCWIVLIASLAHLYFSKVDNFLLDLSACGAVILAVIALFLLPSLKKRTYKDYKTILEKHQSL